MRLRTISLFTMTLALMATAAQAGIMTQYGIFPAGSTSPYAVVSTPGGVSQACTGPAGSTYSSFGSPGSQGAGGVPGYGSNPNGSACTNLEENTPVPYTSADMTTANAAFAFAQFNDPGYTLNSVQVQVYNYSVILSSADNVSGAETLTYNMDEEILISTSAAGTNNPKDGQDGTLATPFYDEKLTDGGSKGQAAYNDYAVPAGDISSTATDYSSEGPNTTFHDQSLAKGEATSNTFNANTVSNLGNAYFAGSGSANIYWQVLGTQTESGNTNATFAISNYVGTEIVLTYNYSPNTTSTPEPTTLLLLGSGLSFVAMRLRRRAATNQQ